MKKYKNLRAEILPCWYELGWREDIPALVLKIHKDVVAHPAIEVTPDAPIVKYFQKKFGFKSFVADFNGNFGFDDALINQEKKGNFVEFLITLPQTKWKTDQLCEDCTGSGVDQFRDNEECYRCKGDGKKRKISYRAVEAISASLNIAFIGLSLYERETSSKLPQLMTIILYTERGMSGAALGGDFTPSFYQWLKTEKKTRKLAF